MSLTCDEVLSRLSLDDGWDQTLEALLHRDDHRRKTPESIFGHQSDLDEQCRSTVISWLLELCSEQLCPVEVPSLAIDLMDRFLIACSHIKRSQLQLVAVVCLSLAAKMRDLKRISEDLLITYADYSVTRKEIKAWEMLVLSKLHWTVNVVLPHDYINVLAVHFETADSDQLISDAKLAVTLCSSRDIDFSCRPPRLQALASLTLVHRKAIIDCHSEEASVSPWLLQKLCVTLQDVRNCLRRMDDLLGSSNLSHQSPVLTSLTPTSSSPASSVTSTSSVSPPSASASPFKVSSASTPKSHRLPLRETLGNRTTRRKLEVSIEEEKDDEVNKENNDSAIGMNTSALAEMPDSSPSSNGSRTGSVHSSPDSGASTASSDGKGKLSPKLSPQQLDK